MVRLERSSAWFSSTRMTLRARSMSSAQPWWNSTSPSLRTDSRIVLNSSVPTEVEARRGVKTKYERGDMMILSYFEGSSVLAKA